jgi:uncharacterized protein (TIGR02266 family)
MTVSAEIERRLGLLRSAAREAAEAGVRDATLDAHLKGARVPAIDADRPFDAARSARKAALQARRDTAGAVRSQLGQVKAQLTTLSQQLLADEKTAQKLGGLVKQQQRAAQEAEQVEVEEDQFAGDQTLPPGAMMAPPLPESTPPPPMPLPPMRARPKTLPPKPPPGASADADARPNRISPRVRMQATVDLHSDNNFFTGFSSNLSDGGLFVATVNLLPIGTEVDVTFSLPSGEKVAAKGTVRWLREVNDKLPDSFPGLGIQFTSLDNKDQAAIDGFLAEREPLFYTE